MSVLVNVLDIGSVSNKYKNEKDYKRPAQETINPELKETEEYCMSQCKSAYSLLVRGKMALSLDDYHYIQLIRDYMSANQPPELYDTISSDNVSKTSNSTDTAPSERNRYDYGNRHVKRKGLDNISKKIVSMSTSLMNAIHGMWDDYEEDIYVDSIDNDSGAEQENAMFEAMFDAQMSSVTNFMEKTYGIPIGNQNGLPVNVSLEEMEVYKETGGFKTYWAESMEEIIHFTEKVSKWNRNIKRKYIEDAVNINFLAGRTKYDPSTRKEMWEYMDPANTFIQYSTDTTFDDAEYAGYFTLEEIGTLVERGFSSDELIKAAQKYNDYLGNPREDDWDPYQDQRELYERIKNYKVPVFHYYWIECDDFANKKTTNQYGVSSVNRRSIDQKISELSDENKKKGYRQEVFKTRLKRAYQCSWVVDTDMVYDYGLVPNQTRKGRKAELPVKAWRGICTNDRMVFGSIAESVIPFFDHLQLAWEKYQDSLSKYHPGGYKINLRLLQNLKIGGEKIDEYQAYKMFWDTGVMPYMDTAIGENYTGGDVSPISRIDGMMAEGVQMFEHEILFIASMIERITGINPITMGVTEQGVTATATNLATTGTQNILNPIIGGVFDMKEQLAEHTSRRIPLLFRNMKVVRDEYSKVVGPKSVDVVRDAERLGAEYGLTMNARPSDQDILDTVEMLNVAIQRGRDGEASINIGQAMYIKERIKSGGNFKKLQRQVDLMIRKSDEETQARKQQNIELESKRQAEIVQIGKQAELEKEQLKTQSKITTDNNEHKNEMQQIMLEKNLDYRQSLMEQEADLVKQKLAQEPGSTILDDTIERIRLRISDVEEAVLRATEKGLALGDYDLQAESSKVRAERDFEDGVASGEINAAEEAL